jgi:hypothetical protein
MDRVPLDSVNLKRDKNSRAVERGLVASFVYRSALWVTLGCVVAGLVVSTAHGQAYPPEAIPDSNYIAAMDNPQAFDASLLVMPVLTFDETPENRENFDKYFYFRRDSTDFVTAVRDVVECDEAVSGTSGGMQWYAATAPYNSVGGEILGNILAQAVFGSAERRRIRRLNLRRCMHFKGYSRYGLPETLWRTFNFQEGLGQADAGPRARMLLQQAYVAASSPQPQTEDLGL